MLDNTFRSFTPNSPKLLLRVDRSRNFQLVPRLRDGRDGRGVDGLKDPHGETVEDRRLVVLIEVVDRRGDGVAHVVVGEPQRPDPG